MKQKFFRIIELPTHQVLLTKDFGDKEEDQDFLLVISFFFDGVKITQSLGYDDEGKRDKAFVDFTDEMAQVVVDGVAKMMA